MQEAATAWDLRSMFDSTTFRLIVGALLLLVIVKVFRRSQLSKKKTRA